MTDMGENAAETIRILLVDDHDVVREGLRALLSAEPDFEVIGSARSGPEAMEMIQALTPDVMLMDITMEGMDGLEVTRRVKACCGDAVKVLALTIHEGQDYFFAMLHAGASGYVPKRAASDDLVQAIRAVARGEIYLHPSVAGALVQDFLEGYDPLLAEKREALPRLTDREREVLTLIGEGLRNQDIAERLAISPKTVSRHRENILRKLNLDTRADLIRYAITMGLIE